MYDVLIIGGGLAGLSLSIDLARRGYHVAVVEKGNYPRHKVCGEYVSKESRRYLLEICPELKHVQSPVINKFLMSSGNKTFRTDLQQGGFGISRYLLEKLLFNEAKIKGVEFFINAAVKKVLENKATRDYSVFVEDRILRAKLVCNSAGRKSAITVNNERGRTNYVGVKYHIKQQRNENLIEIHNFKGGYCGISSIEENKSCLCYIINSDQIKQQGSIKAVEENILSKNPQLENIFKHSEFLFEKPVTISGIDFRIKKTERDGILHLGDSAGTIAPVTGNGMSMALRSAFRLSELVDGYFKQNKMKEQLFAEYDNYWKTNFSRRVYLSRYFQKLSEYPALSKSTIAIFNSIPGLAHLAIRQTYGKPF
jgi:flavin-dependent dehydrogenase